MAKEDLRLRKTGSKHGMRMWIVIIIVILALCIGYVAGQFEVVGLVVKVPQVSCVPQKDFQYFLDQDNSLRANYQKCVADDWNLQVELSKLTGTPLNGVTILPANSTAPSNTSQ